MKNFKPPKGVKVLSEVQFAPAPVWSMEIGKPAIQTIYSDHYYRMLAVIAAVRSGDRILMDLALKNYDAKGTDPEVPHG